MYRSPEMFPVNMLTNATEAEFQLVQVRCHSGQSHQGRERVSFCPVGAYNRGGGWYCLRLGSDSKG